MRSSGAKSNAYSAGKAETLGRGYPNRGWLGLRGGQRRNEARRCKPPCPELVRFGANPLRYGLRKRRPVTQAAIASLLVSKRSLNSSSPFRNRNTSAPYRTHARDNTLNSTWPGPSCCESMSNIGLYQMKVVAPYKPKCYATSRSPALSTSKRPKSAKSAEAASVLYNSRLFSFRNRLSTPAASDARCANRNSPVEAGVRFLGLQMLERQRASSTELALVTTTIFRCVTSCVDSGESRMPGTARRAAR